MTKTTVFCGCSYVKGDGLDLESQDPRLWVNLLHQSVPWLSSTRLLNQGRSGATNAEIFSTALNSMNSNCKHLFVSWTSPRRMRINPGVETYDTSLYLENNKIPSVTINPKTRISGDYIENIRDRFFHLNHYHYDIVNILNYSKTIEHIASQLNIKTYFVNSLVILDKNYFVHVDHPSRKPTDTTIYTRKTLNFRTRQEKEYFAVYDKIHAQYQATGALELNWLNLDQPYRANFYVDRGNDQLHPGPKSNQLFADYLKKKLLETAIQDNYHE